LNLNWQDYAALSALFAALTAIFGKVGMGALLVFAGAALTAF
jgi:uncharacterized membrane protein